MTRQENRGKNSQGANGKQDGCLIIDILTGNLGIVRGYFFKMFGEGCFRNIRSQMLSYEIDQLVDDLCQIVFEVIYRKFFTGTLSMVPYIRSYIYRLIWNKSVDEDKRLAKLGQSYIRVGEPGCDKSEKLLGLSSEYTAEDRLIVSQEADLVHKVLEELTPFERFLICVRYYEGLPNTEIADITGETPNYVGVMLHNIRKKIKAKLEKKVL